MPSCRRLALVAAAVASLAAVPFALAGGLEDRKRDVDARIAELRDRVAAAREREIVLTGDLAAARERIAAVRDRLDEERAALAVLEDELAQGRARLEGLAEEVRRQRELLELQDGQHRLAERIVEERLVRLYVDGEDTSLETLLLDLGSLADLLDRIEYRDAVASHDRRIADELAAARRTTAAARARLAELRDEARRETAALAERTARQRRTTDDVAARARDLETAQDDRRALLERVRTSREEAGEDIEALERTSAELERRLRARAAAAPASAPRPASAAGLIWPVDGPVTSGYGQRWGRLHAGIDIGVPSGTPIRAAAAGTVVLAGWLGGYGNLVVVDHGGGLATAYAHQQRILVSNGATVAQGDVLGEVGSTGNSTGPHLHFEVRVDGVALDPLGYL
ncbi:MAG: peptidoglycan DD-metalloendopeptidase family protein [Thermoleophilia bacterium]